MNFSWISENLYSPVKYVFVAFVVMWSLTLLDSTATTVIILTNDAKRMQGDYSRLSVGTNEIILALRKTNADVVFQSELMQSNNADVIKMLETQQKQLDGLVEYLKKTQPEHKAILQSYVK